MRTKHFSKKEFSSFDKIYKANFINSLGGIKCANLIGTISKDNVPNCAIFSSFLHIGASPALVSILVRPNTIPRDTLENTQNKKFFTINHVNLDIIEQAHITSAKTNRSEFDITGLTAEYLNDCPAPFVKESLVKFSCKYIRTIDIIENGTHLVLGSIEDIYLPEEICLENGDLDLEKAQTVGVTGLNIYNKVKIEKKLDYVHRIE
ncbi:MAG: flavin oxidoreductase [Rickettsiales bacterium]|nr:flavin oxidoreductase [Rickettsiales bacterium]|tara:strand:- start:343 stop:960 length:618 start_codon:yes stop_codon:yes gene_type:complete